MWHVSEVPRSRVKFCSWGKSGIARELAETPSWLRADIETRSRLGAAVKGVRGFSAQVAADAREAPTRHVHSGGAAASAEAGHRHRQIGAGGGEVHPLADQRGLRSLAAPIEALEQPAQGP